MPRLIHQTWKHPHLRWPLSACVDSFRKWNPGWEQRLWTDAECEELIGERLPEFLPTYLAYPKGILRADIFRVAVLYIHGGVYADLDMQCLRPLDDLIAFCARGEWEVMLGRDHPSHERAHYQGRPMWLNAFMIAKPRAKFFRLVLDALERQLISGYAKDDAVDATGPGLLTRIIELGNRNLELLGICEMPWRLVHPLPNVFVNFEERPRYKKLVRTEDWRRGKQVRLLEEEADVQRWGEPPFAAHYWWHSYIENCREVNMLLKYADSLLQTDGEMVERRLNALDDLALEAIPQGLGEGLCELAERGGRHIGTAGGQPAEGLLQAIALACQGLECVLHTDVRPGPDGALIDLILHLGAAGPSMEELGSLGGRLHPRGIVVVPAFETSPPVDEEISRAGFRWLPEGRSLLEKQPAFDQEIPRVIHLFEAGEEPLPQGLAAHSWKRHHGKPWRVVKWTPVRLAAWIEKNVPGFAATFFDYPSDQHRLLAGRWLVLSRLGGVAVMPSLIALRSLEPELRWKRLLFEVKKLPDGGRAISDRMVGSCAGHPFWKGLCESLEISRHKPIEEAVGGRFLSERVRMSPHFLAREDWPSIAEEGTLTQTPGGSEWMRLAARDMWEALAVMYPWAALDAGDEAGA